MGNGAVRQVIGGVGLVLVVVLATVTYAFADSMSAQMVKRLCDRQDKVGWRLSRPLIDPGKCRGEEPAQPTLTFTALPSTITAGATSTLAWSAQNVSSCTASNGWSGAKGTSGSETVAPTATTTYTLTCTGEGGSVSKSVTVAVVPVQQPQAPTLSFTAHPTSITHGASSTLTWDSTNATSCTASNGWTGSKSLDGSESVAPSATTTYGLTCVGAGGTTTQSVTVNVAAPLAPTLSFTVSTSTITQGSTTTLTWDSTNASSCTASGGWSGGKSLDGSQAVSPSATTTYILACTGAGGTATSSVTVNVVLFPQPTVTLTANPTLVMSGGTTTLTWSSTNATSCTAFLGWNGAKATTGAEVITPTATTTYQLDCTGPGGIGSDDAVVNFASTSSSTPLAPTLTFTAHPTTVHGSSTSQATTTLVWDSSHATSCVASLGWTGSKALDGSETFEPVATTTYVLDCMGPGGSVQATTTVNFVPVSTSSVQLNHVIISEVYDQPDAQHGADTTNEWIELYNPTNASVDLSLWTIKDATSNFDTIPQGTTIPAGGFLILTNASTTPSFWSIPGGVQVIAFESALGSGLNNSDETLFLRNAATTTVDSLSWGENTDGFASGAGAVDVVPGHSLYRTSLIVDTDTNADWADHASSTPGLPN